MRVVSPLPPDVVQRLGGLRGAAIAGALDDEGRFTENPAFVELVHRVVRVHSLLDPQFVARVRQQGNGWAYVFDMRTPTPYGEVPAEDIIGAFAVRDGTTDSSAYSANTAYRVFTERGLCRLAPMAQAALMREIETQP
jgi:hypothetical protein